MDKNEIDISDQAEWLKQIKLTSLSNRALTMASKLAHGIRRMNGKVVRLQDQSMAFHLAEQVFEIDDPELSSLFRSFLEEALRVDDSNTPSTTKGKRIKGSYRGVKIESADDLLT